MPVLIAPELFVQVLQVALLISKRSLALQPVDDITVNSNRDLQLKVGSLVISSPSQAVFICGNAIRMRSCTLPITGNWKQDGSAEAD